MWNLSRANMGKIILGLKSLIGDWFRAKFVVRKSSKLGPKSPVGSLFHCSRSHIVEHVSPDCELPAAQMSLLSTRNLGGKYNLPDEQENGISFSRSDSFIGLYGAVDRFLRYDAGHRVGSERCGESRRSIERYRI